LNICIFASGSGTNFKAILDAKKNGVLKSNISLLITNNSKCGAVEIALNNGIEVFHISRKVYPDLSETDFTNLYLDKLVAHNIDLIVLAGYMKMLSPSIIQNYKNRIINIHPALLPSFGGEGMYGMNVHRAVIKAGVKKSGVTIHFVNENYDEGKIIFQKSVNVSDEDDEFTLQKKVLALEHRYYSYVIGEIEKGKI
jgi:phosphoribosylglycinamide formyltransferase 1